MKKDWLDRLQTRVLTEQKAKAPKGLLDDIKKEMAHRGITPMPPTLHKAKIVHLWRYRAASIAAIITTGWYLGSMFMEHHSSYKQVATTQDEVHNTEIPTVPTATLVHKDTQLMVQTRINHFPRTSINSNKILQTIPSDDDYTSKEDNINETVPKKSSESPQTSHAIKKPMYSHTTTTYPAHTRKSDKQSPWTIGIGTTYNEMAEGTDNIGRISLATANPYGNYDPEFSGTNIKDDIVEAESTQNNTKHHRPIKFGIAVSYHINKSWSIETGITYSQLHSDITYSGSGAYYTVKQKLHYIGLPISANYHIAKIRKINFYAKAGGEIEKLVKGEVKQTNVEPLSQKSQHTTITESKPILSAHIALGAEYRLNKGISAYMEPGISHHFNNGSAVDNIYKDKPTNFNLNIGFRVNFNQ